MLSRSALFLPPLLLGATAAPGQSTGPTVPDGRPRLTAVRVQAPPEVDGVLDDAVWQEASFVSTFTQKEPVQGQPATLRTEVALVYDERALYVGARMFSDRPEDIETVLTRRDDSGPAERLIVSLDTWKDRRTAYSFALTAAGVRVDWFHPDDHEFRRDSSFNPVWEGRTRLTPEGWVAEMRIPFAQLRFNPSEEQVWGVNINRYIPRRNEDDFWVVVPRDVTGWSSHFGELHGIRDVPASSRIELLPYAAGELTAHAGGNPRAGTPFADRSPATGRVGLDAKVGLGPNLTLDATLNPDFGQVELDPAQVNLSAFELTFDERRPFFTEGRQLFTAPTGPTWFYSRRIGAAPRLAVSGDFVESPRATPLLGAAKLTGRMPSGLSLGVLGAFTGQAWADTYDFESRETGRHLLESRAGWGVLRAQQELGSEGSVVGATVTGLVRDNTRAEGLTGDLVRQSMAGGADWSLRFLGGEYVLSGFVGGSHQRGSTASILRLQRSSARFFQRPDQDYVRLDPEATSLSGYTAGLGLSRQSGTHWLWDVGLQALSPGFDINDVGQVLTADDLNLTGRLTWRETQPSRWLRNYSIALSTQQTWNYGGVRTVSNVGLSVNAMLPNFWQVSAGTSYWPRAYSDSFTRGGPLMRTVQAQTLRFSVSNNMAETTRWSLVAGGASDELGYWNSQVSGTLAVQPVPSLSLSIEPVLSAYMDSPQYVTTLEGGREEMYGRRYIFATVRRQDLSLRLRASLYITPDLSLEGYAEPFTSRGTYWDFGEPERPRSLGLRRYGDVEGTSITRLDDGDYQVVDGDSSFVLGNPDYNVRSLRSNVVLRWEWRPGSTLYAVWQQDGFLPLARGAALSPHGLLETLRAPGRHTFALKLSWWIPAS